MSKLIISINPQNPSCTGDSRIIGLHVQAHTHMLAHAHSLTHTGVHPCTCKQAQVCAPVSMSSHLHTQPPEPQGLTTTHLLLSSKLQLWKRRGLGEVMAQLSSEASFLMNQAW